MICKCGHDRNVHFDWPTHYWECNKRKLCREKICNCYGYKADNLKYLEMLYERKEVNNAKK